VKTVSLIGVGRLGGALAIALSRTGFDVEQLIYRTALPAAETVGLIKGRPDQVSFDDLRPISSDLLVITTGDDQIEAVCTAAAPFVNAGTVVLHTSGALSSEVLSAAAEKGLATGSMHPLISISDAVRSADLISGAFFCIEGSSNAVTAADVVVSALGGRSFTIATAFKPLYHAAAVLASGHIVALFETAVETLTKCGPDGGRAKEVLFPLLASSVRNLSDQDTAAALTGPFSRVDGSAIQRHLDVFDRERLHETKRIYIEIGEKALDLAERNGAARVEVSKIRETLKLALEKGRC